MRLLFVCPDMRTGGAERHWASLLPELRERGHEVGLACLSERGPFFHEVVARGVSAACLDIRRRSDPRALRRIRSLALLEPDAVVSRGVSGQLAGAAIARRAHAVHVLNEHTPLTPGGELVPARSHQRLLTRVAAPRLDGAIAVTEAQVEPLERMGYPAGRIAVVANGVFPLGAVAPSPELDGPGTTALCVAGLRPEKRVDLFMRAVALARERGADLRGYVAGEGRERERLESLAGRTDVELLGARRDVLELMRAADVVCLTSEAEALPMSVLEAMALERPVLATDVGGTAEAVRDGETGRLVAPGDEGAAAEALAVLAADPERRRAMGSAGRRLQRERFDGDAMVDGYERTLEVAVARG